MALRIVEQEHLVGEIREQPVAEWPRRPGHELHAKIYMAGTEYRMWTDLEGWFSIDATHPSRFHLARTPFASRSGYGASPFRCATCLAATSGSTRLRSRWRVRGSFWPLPAALGRPLSQLHSWLPAIACSPKT